jgi:hypothetical protein
VGGPEDEGMILRSDGDLAGHFPGAVSNGSIEHGPGVQYVQYATRRPPGMCSTSHAGPAVRACVRACVLGQGANWVAGPPPAPLLELAPFVLLRFLVCGVFEAYPPLGTTPGVPGGGGRQGAGWRRRRRFVKHTLTCLTRLVATAC